MKGVAGELQDLAIETARFGEMLADDSSIAGDNRAIGLLQRFDLFAQNLQAQALLIDSLSVHLEKDAVDVAELHQLIGNVPFFDLRERLRAALNGTSGEAAAPAEKAAEEHWF